MFGLWRERFIIQKPVKTRDALGGEVVVWQDLALSPKLYGSLKVLNGGEIYQDGQTVTGRMVEIETHYRADLRTAMRLKLKERIFNIIAIADREGTKKNLQIVALEEKPIFTVMAE
jgi:SPP1 family predicted phage head-tail adaptor